MGHMAKKKYTIKMTPISKNVKKMYQLMEIRIYNTYNMAQIPSPTYFCCRIVNKKD